MLLTVPYHCILWFHFILNVSCPLLFFLFVISSVTSLSSLRILHYIIQPPFLFVHFVTVSCRMSSRTEHVNERQFRFIICFFIFVFHFPLPPNNSFFQSTSSSLIFCCSYNFPFSFPFHSPTLPHFLLFLLLSSTIVFAFLQPGLFINLIISLFFLLTLFVFSLCRDRRNCAFESEQWRGKFECHCFRRTELGEWL